MKKYSGWVDKLSVFFLLWYLFNFFLLLLLSCLLFYLLTNFSAIIASYGVTWSCNKLLLYRSEIACTHYLARPTSKWNYNYKIRDGILIVKINMSFVSPQHVFWQHLPLYYIFWWHPASAVRFRPGSFSVSVFSSFSPSAKYRLWSTVSGFLTVFAALLCMPQLWFCWTTKRKVLQNVKWSGTM